MSVTVIVGGQYGGEGKGKVVSYLSQRDNPDFVVRCGGPNSGHTVYHGNEIYKLRMLPAGFVNSASRLLLAPGCIINPKILLQELEISGIDPKRLGVDRNTVVITDDEIKGENELGLRAKIGSTLSGTGFGVINRIKRDGSARLAVDTPELQSFITDVSAEVNTGLDLGRSCIIEGTQGFGLSLYHTLYYPYATSRDTTAAAFISEVGISPLAVTSIIMVIRTFPIRVEGNSGPLENEITWQELRETSGYPYEIEEYTTVTNRLRRVGKFDLNLVKRAAMVNKPTAIALNGADYLEYDNKGKQQFNFLSETTQRFIRDIEAGIGVPAQYVGTGTLNNEIIDRSKEISNITSYIVSLGEIHV